MSFSFSFKKRLTQVMIFDGLATLLFWLLSVVGQVLESVAPKDVVISAVVLILPLLSVTVHNILRLKVRSWKYCWRIFELLYSLLELIAVGYQALDVAFLPTSPGFFDPSSRYLAYVVASFLITLVLAQILMIYCSLRDIWLLGTRSLFRAYNLSRVPNRSEDQSREIFGSLVWKPRYDPEAPLSLWARSCCAILCAAIIAFVALYQFVVKPVDILSSGQVYFKVYRQTLDSSYHVHSPGGGLVVFPPPYNITGPSNDIITLSILEQPELVPTPSCEGNTIIVRDQAAVLCQWNSTEIALTTEVIFSVDFSRVTPDLPSHALFYLYDGRLDSARETISTIQPTILRPGMHVLGVSTPLLRQTFQTTSIRSAIFGISSSKDDEIYRLFKINELLPNPSPPDVNTSQTASIRLVLHRPDSVLLEVDTREDVIVAGLGFIGGLWTTVNGVFATIFGCTLTLVLFGTKPLSVYGLIPLFYKKRPSLYTDKSSEITQAERDDIYRIIRQHLIDVDSDKPSSQHSEKDAEGGRDQEYEYEPLDLEGRNPEEHQSEILYLQPARIEHEGEKP